MGQSTGLSWMVAAVIVLVLVGTAVPILMVLKGRRRIRLLRPVVGALTITTASLPPFNSVASTYRLDGVITGPGLVPTPVRREGISRVDKWPLAGTTVPVEFEAGDPHRFNILWDQVPTSSQRGSVSAHELARQMSAGPNFHQPGAQGPPSRQVGSPYGSAVPGGPGVAGTTHGGPMSGGSASGGFATGASAPFLPMPGGFTPPGTVPSLSKEQFQHGRATVLTVNEVGPSGLALGVRVLPDDGAPSYLTSVVVAVDAGRLAEAGQLPGEGAQFRVQYDRADPLRVTVLP